MPIQADPAKIEELSAKLKRVRDRLETSERGVQRDVARLLSVVRVKYPEWYVQSALHEVESALREIEKQAAAVADELHRKARALTDIAGQYRRQEQEMERRFRQMLTAAFTVKRWVQSAWKDVADRVEFQKERRRMREKMLADGVPESVVNQWYPAPKDPIVTIPMINEDGEVETEVKLLRSVLDDVTGEYSKKRDLYITADGRKLQVDLDQAVELARDYNRQADVHKQLIGPVMFEKSVPNRIPFLEFVAAKGYDVRTFTKGGDELTNVSFIRYIEAVNPVHDPASESVIASFFKGIGNGIKKPVVATAKFGYKVFTDPAEAWEDAADTATAVVVNARDEIEALIDDPGQYAADKWDSIENSYDAFMNMTPEERAESLGEFISTALLTRGLGGVAGKTAAAAANAAKKPVTVVLDGVKGIDAKRISERWMESLTAKLSPPPLLATPERNLYRMSSEQKEIGPVRRTSEQERFQRDMEKQEEVDVEGTGKGGKWVDEAGNIKWPTNDGFAGKPQTVTLQTGTRIDRYGLENGKFVSPEGTPYGQRSLAPGTESKPYNVYEVVKPFDAQGGKIAPWFDEPGGGIQYKFDKSIKELIDGGYLRRVER